MANDKLGFTFYPKDWWTSDTFFELTGWQRYLYLECLFIMYTNDGYLTTEKKQLERRIREVVLEVDWEVVLRLFSKTDLGYTCEAVLKRLKKSNSSKQNGSKGGAPKGNQNAKKQPNKTTQNNPPLEREREIEEEREININNKAFVDQCLKDSQWCDVVCMQNKIYPEKLFEYVEEFERHLFSTEEQKTDLKEFKIHFTNWIRRQDIIPHPASLATGTNQRQPNYDD